MCQLSPCCCTKWARYFILTPVYLHYSSLAPQVRAASPLQLLIMFFLIFFFCCHSQTSSPPALYSCSGSVMRNLADLISLVALLPRLWAGGVGGTHVFALFTSDSVIILIRALFLIAVLCRVHRCCCPPRLSCQLFSSFYWHLVENMH